MANKILISVIVAVAVFCVLEVHSVTRRNDLIIGNITAGVDSYLYSTIVNVSGIAGQNLTRFVIYNNTELRNVTRIRALDNMLNNTGGFASISDGGLGKRNVTVRLGSSAVGRGLNFTVDFYGR